MNIIEKHHIGKENFFTAYKNFLKEKRDAGEIDIPEDQIGATPYVSPVNSEWRYFLLPEIEEKLTEEMKQELEEIWTSYKREFTGSV